MSLDVALVAQGTVTVHEWRQDPVSIPVVREREYDRLAAELGEALGTTVGVVEEVDRDADALLMPVFDAEELPDQVLGRVLVLDASPSDRVRLMPRRPLGALPARALESWRRGERGDDAHLFGRVEVVERMTGRVFAWGERDGYVLAEDQEGRELPAIVADYLEAWRRTLSS
jgi:hypothetical protein